MKNLKKISVHLKKDNLHKLRKYDLPLSFLIDYLLERELNKIEIKGNLEVINELQKNLQEFISKNKR